MSEVTLEQLQHFWMPSGVPCFLADRSDICEVVESLGFQIYYLIANELEEVKPSSTSTTTAVGGTTTSSYTNTSTYPYSYINSAGSRVYDYAGSSYYHKPVEPVVKKNGRIFKVINNFVGRCVCASDDEMPDNFLQLKEACDYHMPLMPFELVEKMDEFFRLVHTQHGTESIVILTYDTTKEGSDGWGVLVPTQTNTASHCKYDADSIAEIKPDHVMIVGSVHSHPDMPAYASGTDHQDQADFDGIHITYGWQKSANNGATQYHIELQMGGETYVLSPEQVFEDYQLKKDPDPEVVRWSEQVKKAHPPHQAGDLTYSAHHYPIRQDSLSLGRDVLPSPPSGPTGGSSTKPKYQEFVSKLNLPPNSLVFVEIRPDTLMDYYCPSCEFELSDYDFTAGRCCICEIPIIRQSESIYVVNAVVDEYLRTSSLPRDTRVYLYGTDSDGSDFIMLLNEFYANTSIEQSSFVDLNVDALPSASMPPQDIDDDYEDYRYLAESDQVPTESILRNDAVVPGLMVCCSTPIERYEQDCTCRVPIFPEDFYDFDQAYRNVDLYASAEDSNIDCAFCSKFYDITCPSYRSLLDHYIISRKSIDPKEHEVKFTVCSDFVKHPFMNDFQKAGNSQ
jgi:hypothetical protein